MAHEHLINQREYEATLSFIEEYRLVAHDRRLAATLNAIRTSTPSSIDMRLWRTVLTRTMQFKVFHREYPFLVAPPGTLSDRPISTPLRQAADNQRLTLDESELAEHVGIFGRSGGGKTTCIQHFAHEAYLRGINVLTIDGKDDARSFPITYPTTIIIDKDTPIPLLEPPPWLTIGESRPQLIKPLRDNLWGGDGLEQVATESIVHTFERHERPSVANWRDEVRALARKGDTYTRRDRCDGLALRLDRLINQYPGIGTTRVGDGIPPDLLCTRPVYFGFGRHTQIEDVITQWLIELRFSYNRAHSIRRLNTFVLLDESNLLVHDRTISEQAPLATTFPLLREYGIAVGITANNYRAVPPAIRTNLNLQVAMNLTDAAEANDVARTFGLNEASRDYLDKKLTRGTAIAKLADRWKHPFLVHVQDLRINKVIDPAQWEAALARTKGSARTPAAREGVTGQPAPAQPSPSASHAVAATLVKPRIALNTHASTILTYTAGQGVTLTGEAFRATGTHPQAGMRAKKQLLDLALIEEERITIHRRRGGTAVALRPTKSGYDRAGVLRHGTRGGDSIQHEYLVRALAQRINGARIDALVGAKACDLLIPYNELTHHHLAKLLGIRPQDGELIAIEVEVSDPQRTAPRNIARNDASGVAYTIIATVTPLHRSQTGATVIDVFSLMEAL